MDVHKLTWDSCFFGYNVGRIDLTTADKSDLARVLCKSKAKGYRLIYAFIPYPENLDKDVLAKYNGLLADSKITFKYKLGNIDRKASLLDYYVGSADELYPLAYESGIYSRFSIDETFGKETFRLLYRRWVDNSLNGVSADKIFVYRIDREVVGFVTLKINGDEASIGLIAVSPRFRGMSIGSCLIDSCKRYLVDNYIAELSVATQLDNNMACLFYVRNDFSRFNIVNVYHFWL